MKQLQRLMGRFRFLLLLTLILSFAGIAYVNVRRVADTNQWLTHTREVLGAQADLLSSLQDLETGQHGYLIVGEESFLEPYHEALRNIYPRLAALRALTADNPTHQALLTALQDDIDERISIAAETVRAYHNKGPEAAREIVATGADTRKMDAILAQILAMRQTENELFATRRDEAVDAYRGAVWNIALSSSLGIGLIALAWRLTRRELKAQAQMANLTFERMEWYRTTLASIGDAVIATDTNGNVTFLNTVAEHLTGWAETEALGRQLMEVFNIVNEETALKGENPVAKAFASRAIEGLANHTVLVARDGAHRPIEDCAAPIRGAHGELIGAVLVFRDVSHARSIDKALEESEARYRTLIAATANIVWTAEVSGRVTRDSPSWREFTGQTFDEFRDWGWQNALHPDDRQRITEAWERAVRDKTRYEVEYKLLNRDGSYRHTVVRGVPIFEADGAVREWIGMNIDITERKAAESALRESEERFRQVAEMACEWIWEQEPSGRYIYSNQGAKQILGYEIHEILGKHYSEFTFTAHSADTQSVVPLQGQSTGSFFRILSRYRHKNGSTVVTESTGKPVRNYKGDVLRWRGVDIDVTQRVAADADRARMAAIVDSSNDAIIGKDLQGIVTSWNAAAEQIFGFTAEEMVGQPLAQLCPPDRTGEVAANLAKLSRGERIEHFETLRKHKNGGHVAVSITVSPILDERNNLMGASETARDISEQQRIQGEREILLERTQDACLQAELAARAKDEFLALVSHELRTPLNAMLGWAEMLASRPDNPTEVSKAAEVIARNINMQRQLIDDLLDSARIVSGKLHIEMQPVDLVPIIQAAMDVVQPAAKAKNIALRAELPANPSLVLGDATRLQQVVWNLLSNAVKFTQIGGEVRVDLARSESHARVTISDTGKGIAPEFLPHVFDRYAQACETSKGNRHGGLGLGLSLVLQLVEMHGGKVSAESAGEGLGSRFVIDLPLGAMATYATADLPATNLLPLEVSSLSEMRVLVVDDQENARTVLSDALASRGCTVEMAATATEALARLQATGLPYPDVLLCDIGLPDEDGYSLIRKQRAWEAETGKLGRDGIIAVALTGFSRPEDRIMSLRSGFQRHLTKPIEMTELLLVIATLLNERKRD